MKASKPSRQPGKTVVVVGLGAIGSHFIEHLARMPVVGRAVVIDRDRYEGKNVWSQRIFRSVVNQTKAAAAARRMRRINPRLEVLPICADVASVPLLALRADVIVACLDSLAARLLVNQAAWRLQSVWLDGGVNPDAALVRVTGYAPAPGQACFECALNESDYRQLKARHLCAGPATGERPTNSPSSLGGSAAALLAVECEKILSGKLNQALLQQQLVLDVANHKHLVSALPRNRQCRFDHNLWEIEPLPGLTRDNSLAAVFELARRYKAVNGDVALGVYGQVFATALHCANCRSKTPVFYLADRLPQLTRRCPECGEERRPSGFDLLARVERTASQRLLSGTLAEAGILVGDVMSVGNDDKVFHFGVP